MARPREFSEEAALEAATLCFWSRGYEATSIRDLAVTMGIAGASLYNSFGDKHALFVKVLERYVERGFDARVRRLEQDYPPRRAIEMFFASIIDRSLSDPERKGCLVVNSALEVAPHDSEIQRAIGAALRRVEGFFRRSIEAAQRDGTVSSELSADDLARSFLSVLIGIRVLARVRPERKLLEGLLRPVLSLLDA